MAFSLLVVAGPVSLLGAGLLVGFPSALARDIDEPCDRDAFTWVAPWPRAITLHPLEGHYVPPQPDDEHDEPTHDVDRALLADEPMTPDPEGTDRRRYVPPEPGLGVIAGTIALVTDRTELSARSRRWIRRPSF
jgi:hypothetical protein